MQSERRASEDRWLEEELLLVRGGEGARIRLREGSPSAAEMTELRVAIRRGESSFDALMTFGERLVARQARNFDAGTSDGNTLFHLGRQGLARAIRGYRPEAGMRFTSYATWQIQESIRAGGVARK